VATSGTGCIGLLLGIGSEAVTVPDIAGAARREAASGTLSMHSNPVRDFDSSSLVFDASAVLSTLSSLAAYLQHRDSKNG
jgi:hypothetical protein